MATGNINQQSTMSAIDNDDYLSPDDDELSQMSLVEHLEELRWRILKCLIAIAIGAVIAFIFNDKIMHFLESPLPAYNRDKGLSVMGVGEAFTVTLMVSAAVGFILALPVVLYQTWAFVAPGLYDKEKKHAVPFILIGVILFVAGISLGYFVLQYPMAFLLGFGAHNFNEIITAGNYFNFVAFFLLAFGVVFELPLVLTFLAKIELITADTLRKKRAVSHVSMWAAGAILMPGADPYSPVILGIAMSFLFELTIIFIRLMVKNNN